MPVLMAMFQDGDAAFADPIKGKTARPSSPGESSLPTRCPSSELLICDRCDDDHGHDTTVPQKGGDEPVLLEQVLLEPVMYPPRRWPAMAAQKEAPLRRLRSEAYWEQQAALGQRPRGTPWGAGVGQRSACFEEGLPGAAAAAVPAPEAAEGGGEGAAEGCAAEGAACWAGAISRALRRGVRGPAQGPRAPAAAAPPSRGRACRFARGRHAGEMIAVP
ncbi:unnamed protein product [Prorocentrum cordatum]|uniref:Uncharacterized protein n=1 Tax=Prorocentrum cordatum TaxID=2364126 RepID=A0ABN9TPZ9_9DINO|nr:unnamed protein product [Polarella glacialis]